MIKTIKYLGILLKILIASWLLGGVSAVILGIWNINLPNDFMKVMATAFIIIVTLIVTYCYLQIANIKYEQEQNK